MTVTCTGVELSYSQKYAVECLRKCSGPFFFPHVTFIVGDHRTCIAEFTGIEVVFMLLFFVVFFQMTLQLQN